MLNFHSNGDVTREDNGELIGRIDSEGCWNPESDCAWSESEVREELVRQINDPDWADYKFPIEQLQFSGLA